MMEQIEMAFFLRNHRRYDMIVPRVTLGMNEIDLLCVRPSGFIDEIEIKTSLSDYKRDFEKCCYGQFHTPGGKHKATERGARKVNYFYFMLPRELEDKVEVPEYAGLLLYHTNNANRMSCAEVKPARRLHKNKVDDAFRYRMALKFVRRNWYQRLDAFMGYRGAQRLEGAA